MSTESQETAEARCSDAPEPTPPASVQSLVEQMVAAGEWPEPELLEQIVAAGEAAVEPLLRSPQDAGPGAGPTRPRSAMPRTPEHAPAAPLPCPSCVRPPGSTRTRPPKAWETPWPRTAVRGWTP